MADLRTSVDIQGLDRVLKATQQVLSPDLFQERIVPIFNRRQKELARNLVEKILEALDPRLRDGELASTIGYTLGYAKVKENGSTNSPWISVGVYPKRSYAQPNQYRGAVYQYVNPYLVGHPGSNNTEDNLAYKRIAFWAEQNLGLNRKDKNDRARIWGIYQKIMAQGYDGHPFLEEAAANFPDVIDDMVNQLEQDITTELDNISKGL